MAANAFWGGFAESLKGRLDQENAIDLDMQREERLQELKKKYEQEIIDSNQTQIVGNEEVRYNKFGTEISRRQLSPEEIAMRKAAVDKTTADARKSVADAGMSEFDYGNREADRQMALDDAASIRAAREAQVQQGWGSLEVQRTRNRDDREARVQDRLFQDVQKNYNEVIAALEQVGADALGANGITSPAAEAEVAMAEIDGLINAGNYTAANRAIAALKGRLRNPVLKAEAKARDSNAFSLDGSGFALPAPQNP